MVAAIEKELSLVGGTLHWATRFGVGASVDSHVRDDDFARMPNTVAKMAWCQLDGADVTNNVLRILEGGSSLEDLSIARTRIELSAVGLLLEKRPRIESISIAPDQFTEREIADIQRRFPNVRFLTLSPPSERAGGGGRV